MLHDYVQAWDRWYDIISVWINYWYYTNEKLASTLWIFLFSLGRCCSTVGHTKQVTDTQARYGLGCYGSISLAHNATVIERGSTTTQKWRKVIDTDITLWRRLTVFSPRPVLTRFSLNLTVYLFYIAFAHKSYFTLHAKHRKFSRTYLNLCTRYQRPSLPYLTAITRPYPEDNSTLWETFPHIDVRLVWQVTRFITFLSISVYLPLSSPPHDTNMAWYLSLHMCTW